MGNTPSTATKPTRPDEARETGVQPADTLLAKARFGLSDLRNTSPDLKELQASRSALIEGAFPSGALPATSYPVQPVHLVAELGFHPCPTSVLVQFTNSAVAPAGFIQALFSTVQRFFVKSKDEPKYTFTGTVQAASGEPMQMAIDVAGALSAPQRDLAVGAFLASLITTAKRTSFENVHSSNNGKIYGEATAVEEQLLHDIGKNFGYPVMQECQKRLCSGQLQTLEASFVAELQANLGKHAKELGTRVCFGAALLKKHSRGAAFKPAGGIPREDAEVIVD